MLIRKRLYNNDLAPQTNLANLIEYIETEFKREKFVYAAQNIIYGDNTNSNEIKKVLSDAVNEMLERLYKCYTEITSRRIEN